MIRDGHRGPGAAGVGGQGQERLAAILTAASEIASEEGLEQLSMRRLASAVGMSKSGLYAHFTSKEELQLATIRHVLDVFEAKVVRGPPDEPEGALGALLERWLNFFEHKVFPGGCFVITSAVEFGSRRGRVRDALEAAIDREIALLETAIRRASETGEVRTELDASQTAFELHSILMEAHALFHVKQDPAVFERARAAITRLVG
ncbi:MAG TPA: helix-turn-helix domain-containing protein [Thermoleophilaceae bacterium]|nr:helix-turn-helix domain-containing protein [Thermoleophilaceae bacterium]